MNTLKRDAAKIQALLSGAVSQSGTLAALAETMQPNPERLQRTLEQTAGQFERASLELRRLCEKNCPGVGGYGNRPALPAMDVTGFVNQIGYGWLHIELGTLLPHCRYQPPEWLSDTIRRLLDSYEQDGNRLPFFSQAMLVIDEHTDLTGRRIFDQDNKGWKAISNAIKGRLIPDDDQHTLALSLLSTESLANVCHITLLDLADTADFFALHSGDYAREDFYGGGWG